MCVCLLVYCFLFFFFFFNDTATTEIYTLSLHDALPIYGRMVLHLRGETTFMGEEEPLVVVDGIPLGPNASGNLSAINPHDIESIQVLRDAATTSAYGVRGANGVILIRTKQS